MQTNAMAVSVSTAKAISAITPNLASNLVGATTNIELPVSFPAPFLPNSVFTLTFVNMDVSAATVATSSASVGGSFMRTGNSLVFDLDSSLYTSPVSLTGLTVQNLVNNVDLLLLRIEKKMDRLPSRLLIA